MHPRRFIVVALFLVLGLYSIYKGTFCEGLVDIIEEEKRYEVKKTIVNKVVVNQGIISSICRLLYIPTYFQKIFSISQPISLAKSWNYDIIKVCEYFLPYNW